MYSKVLGFLTRATDKSKGEFPILVNPYVLSETTHWGIRGMSLVFAGVSSKCKHPKRMVIQRRLQMDRLE